MSKTTTPIILPMIALLFLGFATAGIPPQEKQEWTREEIKKADNARDWPGLSEDEKDLFLYLNLARVYPKKFVALYLNKEEMRDFDSTEKRYARSLVRDLNALGSIAPVEPNATLMEMARCFSQEKAKTSRTGHTRKRCKDGYFGECLSYTSYRVPRLHILNLLVDAGISDLGHRKIMLNPEFDQMGVALGPHKKYTECAVLDFR